MDDSVDDRRYLVVVNDEEQYSVWPVGGELPFGWRSTEVTGDRAACLAHIDTVWTDLRPRGLREWLSANG
ncbi:MbtH family NRPS accessory protein [Actinoplanes sp. NPDC051346]|uniref:MbtH family protein n=1 Tax=Actinoplanes sp. NPDC051346 TaxID=3155048 RepID=UPI00343A19E0